MSELSDALNKIVEYWDRVHPDRLTASLQPGASTAEITKIEQQLELTFPSQLREFYEWSKGPARGNKLSVVAGGMPFGWLSLDTAVIAFEQFAKWNWQPSGRTVWPFFDLNGCSVAVQLAPQLEAGSLWYNDVPGQFFRICDSMAQYFQTVLDDYPPEDQFPDWETLEETGFSFKSQGKYNYGDIEWLNQVGYGPNH